MLDADRRRYEAWGVVVMTSNVRGAHIANGLVQLLRLLPDAPEWQDEGGAVRAPGDYLDGVVASLDQRFGRSWKLSDAARALCVTGSKRGSLNLSNPTRTDSEAAHGKHATAFRDLARVARAGREHLDGRLGSGADGFSPAAHRAISEVINADGRVRISQAADPTTPGFTLAGYSSPNTLHGMHAATYLGLLAATKDGAACIARLRHLLADETSDPHSALIKILGIAAPFSSDKIHPRDARDAYPLPATRGWAEWAGHASDLTGRLLDWSEAGASKAETLMGVIDLACLLLSLRLLRWDPDSDAGVGDKLLLVVSHLDRASLSRLLVERAQVSLMGMEAGLNQGAEREGLILERENTTYFPGNHALNLAASGGWLYPRDARGGPKRYFSPGPRQLTTLVHAIVGPNEQELTWDEFTRRAQSLGLAFGGLHEHGIAQRLHFAGGAATVRDAGIVNRDSLIALGLARRESDDVIRIDGGER